MSALYCSAIRLTSNLQNRDSWTRNNIITPVMPNVYVDGANSDIILEVKAKEEESKFACVVVAPLKSLP